MPFAKRLETTRLKRARDIAKSAAFWVRQHYRLPPTDPRYLAMSIDQILDEYEAFCIYMNMANGGGGQESFYSSSLSLEQMDAMLDNPEQIDMPASPATPTDDPEWDDLPDDFKALDRLLDRVIEQEQT